MQQLAEALSILMSNAFALYVKTWGFHWNVTGPRFTQLHSLFGDQYSEQASALDLLAEAIRQMDFFPPSSMAEFLEANHIPEQPEVPSADEMVAELMQAQEAYIGLLNDVLGVAKQLDCEDVVVLIGDRLIAHKKQRWMLRSHLEQA